LARPAADEATRHAGARAVETRRAAARTPLAEPRRVADAARVLPVPRG